MVIEFGIPITISEDTVNALRDVGLSDEQIKDSMRELMLLSLEDKYDRAAIVAFARAIHGKFQI